MQADISGHQRKVVRSHVRPDSYDIGDGGIVTRGGMTHPFVVARGWNAPAGHYVEQWFLIDPETREVHLESHGREISIWGLQSVTDLEDVVRNPVSLAPGNYRIVFSLGGVMGGELDVEVTEAPAEHAA